MANIEQERKSVADLRAALAARQAGAGRLQQPVALIGPGDASADECEAAHRIAGGIARAGFAVICGGRGGVMEASAQGAVEAGGVAIGMLPEEDARHANAYLTVAVPTGMGELRNGIIARSALCLVAVGGSVGTLSEIALGLRMGKTVLGLASPWNAPGMQVCDSPEALELAVLRCLWDIGR